MTLKEKGIRLMTLQNRMALDVILVDRGGSACCVFVDDDSSTIFEAIKKMHVLSTELPTGEGGWGIESWFWGILRSWGWKLTRY